VTSKDLNWRQRKALPLLVVNPNLAEVADIVGVTERTIFRWLNDPSFHIALRAAEGEAINAATLRLLALGDKAITVLEGIIDDQGEATNQRRLAAQAVLDYLLKLRELRNIEERIASLEAAIYIKA
jgi:ABC-type transporter Mla subunit MlaD